jgi:DNA end-binding protein Ku
MKIIWKGSITFGLVNIPIKLYSAILKHALGFTLVHTTCGTPLQYKRWCPYHQKDVAWAETSKGIKTSKSKRA